MDRIADLLKEFAARIRAAALEETFESMKAAMGQGGGATRRGPGRPRNGASVRRVKGGKRDPKELDRLEKMLLGYIDRNPGKRAEQIGQALKLTTKDMQLPIRKLRAAKKISMKGTRRAAKYFVSK